MMIVSLLFLFIACLIRFCYSNLSSRQQVCLDTYTTKLQDIYSVSTLKQRIHALMKNSTSISSQKCPFPGNVIINTSPGSTGTTSLFLASMMLNITSVHHMSVHANCNLRHLAMDNLQFMNYLEKLDQSNISRYLSKYADIETRPVMMLDTPYSQLWLDYLTRCPNATYIFTDIAAAKWNEVRRPHLLAGPQSHYRWDLTVPIPFIGKRPHDDDLLSIVSLLNTTAKQTIQAFEAYRTFVSCTIPPQKLTVINLASLKSSARFWHCIFAITRIQVSPQMRQELIEAGVPHMGSKGCNIGDKMDCNNFEHNIHKLPGVCRSHKPSQFRFDAKWA